MNWFPFAIINVVTEWVPVLISILLWKRLLRLQKSFFWFLFITSGIDLYSTIRGQLHEYNIFLLNFNYLIEGLFLTHFYHSWLTKMKFDGWYLAGAGIYTIYYLFTTSFSPGTISENTVGRIIQCLAIAAYSGIVLINLSNELETSFLRSSIFWFAASSLILYSTELIIYCAYTIFQENFTNLTLYSDIWSIHSIFAILANFLYSIAFICRTPARYKFQLRS